MSFQLNKLAEKCPYYTFYYLLEVFTAYGLFVVRFQKLYTKKRVFKINFY